MNSSYFKASCIFILTSLAIVGGILITANGWLSYTCNQYSANTGKETRLSSFDACYIKHEGNWLRWDEYKMRIAAIEGLTQ